MGRDYLKVGYYTEIFFVERDVRYIAINDGVDSAKGDNDFTPFRNLFKNKRCLGGGTNKKLSNLTNSPDSATYCFYSTRPTKR